MLQAILQMIVEHKPALEIHDPETLLYRSNLGEADLTLYEGDTCFSFTTTDGRHLLYGEDQILDFSYSPRGEAMLTVEKWVE